MKKVISDDPIYTVHEYDIDPDGLNVFLVGEPGYNVGVPAEEGGANEPGVEYQMSTKFIKNLHIAMRNGVRTANKKKGERKYQPIVIHMKTCGGDWQEGMAIYDTIRTCPNPTTILCYTHARSMSSIILQAANKRIMMPHSYFMFHQGDAVVGGTIKQVQSLVEFSRRDDEIMLNIYADQMKRNGRFKNSSRKTIKEWLVRQMNRKEDVYLTAKEAVDYGLADEIFDGNWAKLGGNA